MEKKPIDLGKKDQKSKNQSEITFEILERLKIYAVRNYAFVCVYVCVCVVFFL